MCVRFLGVDFELIKQLYRVSAPRDLQLIMEYDDLYLKGWDHPYTTILEKSGEGYVADVASWGLIPSYHKGEVKDFKLTTYNGVIEELEKKTIYKANTQNRCLIPAAAFFDFQWSDLTNPKCKKIDHIIRTADGEPFCFAGIFSTWKGIKTFTILTTKANPLMAEVHNSKERMPVVLKREDEENFLAGADFMDFAYPGYEVELVAERVDKDDTTAVQATLF